MEIVDKNIENPSENIVTLGEKVNMNHAAIRPDATREQLQKIAVGVSLVGCNAALQSKKPEAYDKFRNEVKKLSGIRIGTIDKAVDNC